MEKREMLAKQIYEKDKEFEKNKFRRTILAIVGISIFFFLLCFKSINDFKSFLIAIVGCLVGAVFYFYFNMLLFVPLFSKSAEENKILEDLKKKYKELDKEN